ncbi:MAG: nucleotidyltransferase domain-containing protein [Candidatus Woesearchaeota archaeon]
MEVKIKKTIKAGNSSAVVLPRSWLHKDVRIELVKKTFEDMVLDVIEIVRAHIELKEIIGVYLTGSYAREEEDEHSDIDIMVVTKDIDKQMIHEGIYNILIISTELLKQKLKQDLLPVGQMIKESKAILNSDYLSSIKIKVTKKNISWYIDTSKDKLRIIKKILKRNEERGRKGVNDLVIYTLVLRIRTLDIIKKLIKNEDYSKKDFIKTIRKISKGERAYERYLAVKNNLEEKEVVSLEEAKRLYEYFKDQLSEVKRLLRG